MRTLVISDVHLGNGKGYDIFAAPKILPGVIDHFVATGGGMVFVNGDGVDFLMNTDPLSLNVKRAVAQARDIANHPDTATVFQAFGRALAAGSEVVIRLGNHDIELGLPAVQEVFRGALGQPEQISAKLAFHTGQEPDIIEIDGVKILMAHGEHSDAWNRVDYPGLLAKPDANGDLPFTYPPGSRLVKTILNPLKKSWGMRFADLLKPDFQGAVLTAMAVDPSAMQEVFQGSTLNLLWQLFRESSGPMTFGPGAEEQVDEPDLGFADMIDGAGLEPDEFAALQELFDEDAVASFGLRDSLALGRAKHKLIKQGLKLYSRAQRRLTGDSGKAYFSLEPSEDEVKETRRLGAKYDADVVIIGHTHSARFKKVDQRYYINTGTWIWLMGLPAPDADDKTWVRYLDTIRNNPGLDPSKGECAPLIERFTGAIVEAAKGGGVRIALLEYKAPGGGEVLAEEIIRR